MPEITKTPFFYVADYVIKNKAKNNNYDNNDKHIIWKRTKWYIIDRIAYIK